MCYGDHWILFAMKWSLGSFGLGCHDKRQVIELSSSNKKFWKSVLEDRETSFKEWLTCEWWHSS